MYSSDIRKIAISLYNNKFLSLRKIAKLLEINHSTISRWKNRSAVIQRKKRICKLGHIEIINSIDLYISSHPFCSIKDVKLIIQEIYKIDVSLELVRLCIVKNNFTKKRVRYYSKPKDDELKLKIFIDKRNEYVSENRKFISIDETSFGRNYQSAFGYSKKGQRLYIKRLTSHIKTYSVVSAVSIGDPICYYKKEGSFNTDSFYLFLNNLDLQENYVLVMDNVSFHHSKKIKEFAMSKKVDILYVPPYSPVFNPIEGIFSIVKRHYQKFMSIKNSFESVTNDHIKSFFKQSFNAVSRF